MVYRIFDIILVIFTYIIRVIYIHFMYDMYHICIYMISP